MDYKTISYLTIALVIAWAISMIYFSNPNKLQTFVKKLKFWFLRIKNWITNK